MKHIMTEEEIQHRIKAAEAFLRGGECEGQFMDGEWRPVRETSGEREWSGNAFFDPTIKIRIKAPPTFIPLEQKDWANGPWYIVQKDGGGWQMVLKVFPEYVSTCCKSYTHEYLLSRGFKRSRTCLPDSLEVCGKEVQS